MLWADRVMLWAGSVIGCQGYMLWAGRVICYGLAGL